MVNFLQSIHGFFHDMNALQALLFAGGTWVFAALAVAAYRQVRSWRATWLANPRRRLYWEVLKLLADHQGWEEVSAPVTPDLAKGRLTVVTSDSGVTSIRIAGKQLNKEQLPGSYEYDEILKLAWNLWRGHNAERERLAAVGHLAELGVQE